jgi:hypothetical protein
MYIVILANKESVDRYWEWKRAEGEWKRARGEWKRAGGNMNGKFLHKILPFLRPAVNVDQHRAPLQMDHHRKDGKPPHYPSKISLLLNNEVMK